MRSSRTLLSCILALVCLAGILSAQQLTDPYAILKAHFDALGGLDRLQAEKTSYLEGTVSMMGMEGTIKKWEQLPDRKRQEMELGPMKMVGGDNGEFAWMVDINGKIQIQKDEATLKKRQVDALMAAYRYADPESEHFTLTFGGMEKVDDVECYLLQIANDITDDVRLEYFDASSLYLKKSVAAEEGFELHTLYSDYREVDGMMVPFHLEAELQPLGQKQVIQITDYQSNPQIDPSIFDPPAADTKDFRFLKGHSAEGIPFDYIMDHLFIEVETKGQKHLWVLDSGASATVIDSTYAASLGLESVGRAKALGAGGPVDISLVILPAYSIPGIQFSEQQVAVMPLRDIFKRRGIDIAGVLGYDFLSRFVTRIDYANKRISFFDPEQFTYQGQGTFIDAPISHRLFFLPLTVDGKYSGDWGLDIGASVSGFQYPFAEENNLLDRPGVKRLVGGAGGYFPALISEFDSLKIGAYRIENPLIMVPLEGSGALDLERPTGILGNNILRRFVLYLDYTRQQLILEKGADFDRDFPRDKSGLSVVIRDDGTYEVLHVSPGTPAEEAGLTKGDILQAIDGKPVETFAGPVAIDELFKAAEGTEYDLAILRDGKPQQIRITLRNLY